MFEDWHDIHLGSRDFIFRKMDLHNYLFNTLVSSSLCHMLNTSKRDFCCTYLSRCKFYWDDDVHILFKGVLIHIRLNWIKWTYGHYLVLFLPSLFMNSGCTLLMLVHLILHGLNSRINFLQEEGNDSIHGSML